MTVETAKQILNDEIADSNTDLHEPLSNKYARWKIIDYLWSCSVEKVDRGESLDWLKSNYKEMTENEMRDFTLALELICSTIERAPQSI